MVMVPVTTLVVLFGLVSLAGLVEVAAIVTVSVVTSDQSVQTRDASSQDGLTWQLPIDGADAYIAAGGIRDAFGNTNRQCVDLIGQQCDQLPASGGIAVSR